MFGVVICTDATRRAWLVNAVRDFATRVGGRVSEYATVQEAGRALAADPGLRPDFFIFSLVGGADLGRCMGRLRRRSNGAPIIVEIEDDDPHAIAFEAIDHGAYNVVTALISKTEILWETISKGINQQPPYGPILPPNPGSAPWGFMSMKFEPMDENDFDYRLAISPAMRRLNLQLDRLDEMIPRSDNLRENIEAAIDERPVLVALMSSITPNTIVEITRANGLNKDIIYLRRQIGSDPVPATLAGYTRVEYSSRTELAMKLYFGLGGNHVHAVTPAAAAPARAPLPAPAPAPGHP